MPRSGNNSTLEERVAEGAMALAAKPLTRAERAQLRALRKMDAMARLALVDELNAACDQVGYPGPDVSPSRARLFRL